MSSGGCDGPSITFTCFCVQPLKGGLGLVLSIVIMLKSPNASLYPNAHLPASLQRWRTFPCRLLSKHSIYGCGHKVQPRSHHSKRLCCRSLDSSLGALWHIVGDQFWVVGAEIPLVLWRFDPFFFKYLLIVSLATATLLFFFFVKEPVFQMKLGFSLQPK